MEVRYRPGVPRVVRLSGELNVRTVRKALRKIQIAIGDCEHVSIDLSRVGKVDSAGIQLFLYFHRWFAIRGMTLYFIRPSKPLQRLLELHGIASLESEKDGSLWSRRRASQRTR